MFTTQEAKQFRTDHDASVKMLNRMSKAQLHTVWTRNMSEHNMTSLFGGPVSKDELMTAILDLTGYTNAKLNEAIHVLYHGEMVNDICEFCSMVPPF